jgi:hypothetical protein
MASDGRSAEADDRAAHSSLVWGDPTRDYLMVGLTDKEPSELMPLARSWNYPAELTGAEGCISYGYAPEERAYILGRTDENISFTLNGSVETPLFNPAFVIKNWKDGDSKAGVKLNGRVFRDGSKFRQGVVYDTDGSPQLIVWIKYESEASAVIEIREK